jgi:hypothetical protein
MKYMRRFDEAYQDETIVQDVLCTNYLFISLADYLRHEISDMEGQSQANLFYMRDFAGLSQAIKWSSSLLDKYPGSIVRLVWDDFVFR